MTERAWKAKDWRQGAKSAEVGNVVALDRSLHERCRDGCSLDRGTLPRYPDCHCRSLYRSTFRPHAIPLLLSPLSPRGPFTSVATIRTNTQAINRLPKAEGYERVYRMRVAFQQDLMRRPLPKEEWLPADQDTRYLTPYIAEVAAEDAERAKWDSIEVERKAAN